MTTHLVWLWSSLVQSIFQFVPPSASASSLTKRKKKRKEFANDDDDDDDDATGVHKELQKVQVISGTLNSNLLHLGPHHYY